MTVQSAFNFFYEHAGFGYRCAEALAKAEQWAEDNNLVYVWEEDTDTSEDDFDFPEDKAHVREYGTVGCILYRPCADHGVDCKHAEMLGSLWGITESLDNRKRDAYRRMVRAELALEAMPEGV